jgi:plasmid maintenance system antidote protein VapI
MTPSPPLIALQKLVDADGFRKVGKALGASHGYLSDVLRGRRPLSEELALKLGYRKKVTWIKITKD